MSRAPRVTKRPTYFEGVAWIANNDNTGAGDDVATIAGYVSTLLLADLFGADPHLVAIDIERARAGGGFRKPGA